MVRLSDASAPTKSFGRPSGGAQAAPPPPLSPPPPSPLPPSPPPPPSPPLLRSGMYLSRMLRISRPFGFSLSVWLLRPGQY
ncbi:MAG: hypothetical protein CMF72_22615 [Mameliella sp.]|nr:hypothetical protein [Mameliella sp.]